VKKCGFEARFLTVKNHYGLHYCPFIILFEDSETFSTQAGEMCHKGKVKIHFKKSNQRGAAPFVSPFLLIFSRDLRCQSCSQRPPGGEGGERDKGKREGVTKSTIVL